MRTRFLRARANMSLTEFADQFSNLAERSIFRLETLDAYYAPNEQEPWRRFLSGEPQDLSWRDSWRAIIGAELGAGKTMSRVHVVTEPLGPYVKFELTCAYPSSVEAGEDIRILPRAQARRLPRQDFWLFDSRQVVFLDYNQGGALIGLRLTDRPRAVARCCRARDAALALAVPLGAYLEEAGLVAQVAIATGGDRYGNSP